MDKFAKPAHKGLIVRFPGNKAILPVAGATIPWTGVDGRYWRRRFKDGSIILVARISYEQSKNIPELETKHTYKKEKGHK